MTAVVKEKIWVTNLIWWWNQMERKLSNAQIRLGAANAIFVNVIRNWPKIWPFTRANGTNQNILWKAASVVKKPVSRRNRHSSFKNAAAIDSIFQWINQEKIINAVKVQKRNHSEPVAQTKWQKSKLKILARKILPTTWLVKTKILCFWIWSFLWC